MALSVTARIERFPTAGAFVISRETRTEQVVVLVEVGDGTHVGRGECVPYKRYGEAPDGVVADILSTAGALGQELSRERLQSTMKAGAARNGLDCALWDLEAKATGRPAWALAGLHAPRPLVTCYTLSLGSPQQMHAAALAAADRPVLKVKLGGDGDADRIRAVRSGAPKARLVVDANEAWRAEIYDACMAACVEAGVELVEQPLPAADDAFLETARRPVPVCADESLHDRGDLARLRARYDAINIKLDKAGGLTEALLLSRAAVELGFKVMVGCMLATSLGMAPAILVAQDAAFVDLDGPLLLAKDRPGGLIYVGSVVHPPSRALWG
jgi:L-alanine-DL-glutamate epimerase-like enolase superfamily enzyme